MAPKASKTKTPPSCIKVKNPCKFCLQSVTAKTGLQCQGACKKWAHFSCLNYTPGKISDIKAGIIKVTCPCPDCETTQVKEFLANPPFTCSNHQCPANINPKCASAECPSNKKTEQAQTPGRPVPMGEVPSSGCDNSACSNQAIPCSEPDCPKTQSDKQNQPRKTHPRMSPPRPPTPPRGTSPQYNSQIQTGSGACLTAPKGESCFGKNTNINEKNSTKNNPKHAPKVPSKHEDPGRCPNACDATPGKKIMFNSPPPKSSFQKSSPQKSPPKSPHQKSSPQKSFLQRSFSQISRTQKSSPKSSPQKSPPQKSPSLSLLSSDSLGCPVKHCPPTSSSSDSKMGSPRAQASMVQAIQEMCSTVGKLSVQLKDLMCKMMQT